MDFPSEVLESLIDTTLLHYQQSTEPAKETLSRILNEYNNTLLTGAEKLHQTAKREKNRWQNCHLWLESKKIAALEEFDAELTKESSSKEVLKLCQEKIDIIDLFISRTKTKIELFEIDAKRVGDLLREARIKQLEFCKQIGESINK